MEQFSQANVTTERSINVVTALSSTDTITSGDILDYAYRPKNTKAMLFDIYSSTVTEEEARSNFMSVISKLGSRFVVMDLNGDPRSTAVKNLIDQCDVVLYLFRPIKKECDLAKEYIDSLSDEGKLKVKLVCNMWDEYGVRKSSIQEYMGIKSNNILWFPYHVNIQRTMFEGRLCILNRLMIEGRDQCISLRQPIKDILSYVCDTSSIKVVRDVNKWQV